MQLNSQKVFFALVRAGLWEQDVRLLPFGKIDMMAIYQLAEEQSVMGLVTAGLEHVKDITVHKDDLLQFIGSTLQIEERNKAMNVFVAKLIEKLRAVDIDTLLVKGQGIALCYERPMWRVSGDVDLYMSEEAFEKAKMFFRPLVSSLHPDNVHAQHVNMHYGDWVVEIHSNQRTGISDRIDRILDEIHHETFYDCKVRKGSIGETLIKLPTVENDVLVVFTHFLKHFYKGGIGIRQICDWCRLLYAFKDAIDKSLLEARIRKMGLVSEWKSFASYAVLYLGMPEGAMPLYEPSGRFVKKAHQLQAFILEVGNFGHNRDSGYFNKPYLIRKYYSMRRRIADLIHHARLFPLDSIRFFPKLMFNGFRSALRGE